MWYEAEDVVYGLTKLGLVRESATRWSSERGDRQVTFDPNMPSILVRTEMSNGTIVETVTIAVAPDARALYDAVLDHLARLDAARQDGEDNIASFLPN